METNTSLYPKNPENVTKKLTQLPASYLLKAILAILAIILFFMLYTALVAGLGYLVYYAFIYNIGSINKFTILLKIGAIAGSIMLFSFTLKFVFKLKNHKPTNRIRLQEKEQVDLWKFIDQICTDTGAPKPKNIYLDPDVNAYVAYTNTWLSLFLPIRKNLTIGMGLIETLTLSEFKAVISHEFGHFAQKSMKIGSYINSANTIIHDMIYSRDKWDQVLEEWRSSDIRLSAAAWIITPIIWIIRQILSLFYQFLNLMYSSLSREMEFNADKVAVSTSGSEAIIAALWKLDLGFENWNSTLNHAYLASKKKIHTKNLYLHNKIAHERTKETQLEKLANLPKDPMGNRQYFSSNEHSKVNMYASHPPNNLREQNAKQPFIPCATDNRSPWILFKDTEKLQEEMTVLVYMQYLNTEIQEIATVETFENFIAMEAQGKELLAEYHNTFLNRFLFIDEEKNLIAQMEQHPLVTQKGILKLKEELVTLMKPVENIESLMQKAVEISQGTTKDNSFQYKEQHFRKQNIQEGYDLLNRDREKLFNETFKEWDTNFCIRHLALAKQLGSYEELLNIYKQHAVIVQIYKAIANTKTHIYSELEKLQQRTDVEQHEINTFGFQIKELINTLNTEIDKIERISFIPISNIDDAQELKEAIVDTGKFTVLSGNIFENDGFNRIANDLENAVVNCQRIEQKNIILILSTHHAFQQQLTSE